MKRMRGRNHRGGSAPIRHQSGNVPLNRNHVFDSNGPDLRIRGTSQQLFEKYLQLGRDATSSADRFMAESYFQHAEHYFRVLNAMNQAAQAQSQANNGGPQRRPPFEGHGAEQPAEEDEEDAPPAPAMAVPSPAPMPAGSDGSGEMREIPIAAVPPER